MLNHISIAGRLTRDIELKRTQSGYAVTTFSVAVDRDYKDQSGERGVDFIDCTAWRQTAEFISRYFSKGRMILIDGRLQSRKWQDSDGKTRTSWEILVEHAYFGGDKPADNSGGYGAAPGYGQSGGYGGNYGAAGYGAPPTQTTYGGGYGYGTYQQPAQPGYGAAANPAPQPTAGANNGAVGTEIADDDGDLPF